ncbi:DUF167 domain-containing protein [Legionella longbeachae]|uniref:UPF0235 protein LLO_0767 n=1 Tax=Legionella longbeachae serogroup 1 (strain NSW150) TaxID=661367 RepID=D3HQE1_LEGLN|nr:DUF167 family protein [Legionella longbeachae]VEE01627.1 Uncharacterised ACR, YggU family COG1872 [Legionella oakridgensis]HBD7396387.1 YggU family protein [Legionella pneumophila]ARB92032.1 YggU family protein [Legionella longbeachae]QEY50728.1 YggU family protein [Legionella longbeachae]QIN31556.1 YggU family protein [Legionella longbeachae]
MWYKREAEHLILYLYVQPGAKKSEIVGMHEGVLKIRLNAPPIEGRANKELLKYVAQLFKVPPSQVVLKRGDKSRHKVLLVKNSLVDPNVLF